MNLSSSLYFIFLFFLVTKCNDKLRFIIILSFFLVKDDDELRVVILFLKLFLLSKELKAP